MITSMNMQVPKFGLFYADDISEDTITDIRKLADTAGEDVLVLRNTRQDRKNPEKRFMFYSPSRFLEGLVSDMLKRLNVDMSDNVHQEYPPKENILSSNAFVSGFHNDVETVLKINK